MDSQQPSDVIRHRLREVRERQGLTRPQLSERLAAIGYPIEALTLARIETGRVRRLSVDDLYALAYALDVSPLFLMIPYGDRRRVDYEGETVWLSDETVAVAAHVQPVGPHMLRNWLRGYETLPGQDGPQFNRELPPDELEALRSAAASLVIGRPTVSGAAQLRNELVATGKAEPPPVWSGLSEAVAAVQAKSNAEVLDELGITTFDEQTAEVAKARGADVNAFRAERMERLREALLQEYVEAAQRGRPATRGKGKGPA